MPDKEMDILEKRPDPPQLDKASILFVLSDGGPKRCGNCMMKSGRGCTIHPKSIIVEPVKSNGETYTPVCGYWVLGKPQPAGHVHLPNDPALTGLVWVRGKGTNCGGADGGCMCDVHYTPEGKGDGFCDVLQENVQAGECCAAWDNDDAGETLKWQEAQRLLKPKKEK